MACSSVHCPYPLSLRRARPRISQRARLACPKPLFRHGEPCGSGFDEAKACLPRSPHERRATRSVAFSHAPKLRANRSRFADTPYLFAMSLGRGPSWSATAACHAWVVSVHPSRCICPSRLVRRRGRPRRLWLYQQHLSGSLLSWDRLHACLFEGFGSG